MSQNIIFYFTGTGNSLAAARDIAKVLGDCQLASMKEIHKITEPYERIGFVFPVYAAGLPSAVKVFVEKMDFSSCKSSYFFAVPTCGAAGGNGIADINKRLQRQGVSLSYGKALRMFANYVGLYPMANDPEERAKESAQSVLSIANAVLKKETTNIGKSNPVMGVVHKLMAGTFATKDRGFHVSDECNGCGMCKKVCPVKNITMADKKPTFSHNCEQCMACIQWCPKQAINYKNKTQTRGRYHHPDVVYGDLVQK